jgi:putative ABC transport system permease protein
MFKNHLKVAVRNLLGRKGFSLFNVLGLVAGITCCLLIFQYAAYEKSYDTFPRKADEVVRLRLDLTDQGKVTMQSATVYPGLGTLLKKDFPEVENYCRIVSTRISWSKNEMVQNNVVLSNDEKAIKASENKGYYADPSFLGMFSIPVIGGNPEALLNGPNKMMLSESLAKKYFSNDDPVNKKMAVREGGNTYYYEVTGVFKDYPVNSHLSFDYLISYPTFVDKVKSLGAPKWLDPETTLSWYDYYVYLQLTPGTSPKKFESKLPAFCDRYMNSKDAKARISNRQDLYVMPLKDIHLRSHLNQEAGVNGDGKSVSFLFLVGFLIIAIAWINYANLATARSLERAREVGVRKVLGALRRDLVGQFLTESFLLNMLAVVIATGLAFLLTGSFNRLIGSSSVSGFHLPLLYWVGFISLFFGGTFLSGIYPAFVLSGYHPIAVLKGMFKNSTRGMIVRKGLIVGQFATSIILIAGTIIIYQQVNFMRNQKLGADINQTLVLDGPNANQDAAYQNSFQSFKNEVLQIGGVKNIAASSGVMGKEIYLTNGAYLVNSKEKNAFTVYTLYVDNDFLSAYGLEFKAGRNFSTDNVTDKKAIVLSEEAAKLLGINEPGKAINELVYNFHDSLKVIGVVANYHQMGLNRSMMPVVFVPKQEINNFYSVKFQTSQLHQAIGSLEKVWSKYFPESPFSYFFLDESFNEQYKSDEMFGKVFGLFSFLAILIACFGLLGLSAYNVLQRTKEIGVRKVLGASVPDILLLLSKDFLLLIGIAFVVAVPVTWWIMNNWLRDFPYRIPISWIVFLIAGIAALTVALAAISLQAIKAAVANPVKSLRTE